MGSGVMNYESLQHQCIMHSKQTCRNLYQMSKWLMIFPTTFKVRAWIHPGPSSLTALAHRESLLCLWVRRCRTRFRHFWESHGSLPLLQPLCPWTSKATCSHCCTYSLWQHYTRISRTMWPLHPPKSFLHILPSQTSAPSSSWPEEVTMSMSHLILLWEGNDINKYFPK